MLVFGVRCHRLELLDVPVPDPKGEELDAQGLEQFRRRPGISAVGVAVRDQENGFAGMRATELETKGLKTIKGKNKYQIRICKKLLCLK